MPTLKETYNRTPEVLASTSRIFIIDKQIERLRKDQDLLAKQVMDAACPFRPGQTLKSSQGKKSRVIQILPFSHPPFYLLKLERIRKDGLKGVEFSPYGFERWELVNNGVITVQPLTMKPRKKA